jgi:hypothetical protein
LRSLLLTVIAALAMLSLVQGQALATTETFSFGRQTSFVDESRILRLLGEVKNDSDTAMTNVIVKASFYDNEGNVLGEYQRSSELRVINPSESSPFEILYLDQATSDSVANYTLSATGQPTDAKEKRLVVTSSNSRLDVLGIYYINARASNEGPEKVTNVVMTATLYDSGGNVIAIGKALAEATRGVFDMEPNSEAAFGMAITSRLQTHKTAQYSLVVDSDQYMSETVFVQVSGPGLRNNAGGGNQTQSGCLIATAAFGSELVPQVQQLRGFRDGIALQTFAGSSFMNVFNAWYYSFSPSVADYERGAPWLQSAVRAGIYPLLAILDASAHVYGLLAFNGELGIIASGITASSLVGLLYFAPFAALAGVARRKKQWNLKGAKYALVLAWSASLAAIVLGEILAAPGAMMFGTALLVLSAIGTVVIAALRAAARL